MTHLMHSNSVAAPELRAGLPKALPAARRQAGMTIVEFMVAVVIGMLVLVALAAVYLNVSRSNTEMARTTSVIENGRFAIKLLEDDLVHGGYWGGFVPQYDDSTLTTVPGDFPASVPAPCTAYGANWTAAYKTALIGVPLQTYEDVPTDCATISLLPNKKANSDVLVIRHADTCVAGDANCAALAVNQLYFQVSQCMSGTNPDTKSYLMDTYTSAGVPFNLHKRKTDCATAAVADLRRFVSNIYYVRDYANTVGDGIPTLVRSEFGLKPKALPSDPDPTIPEQLPGVPLVEGIESFRIELGIDSLNQCGNAANYAEAVSRVDPATCTDNTTDPTQNTSPKNRGDGAPDGDTVRCLGSGGCTRDQLVNAVVAKVYVLARARDETPGYKNYDATSGVGKTYQLGSTSIGPFQDGFKRHVYSTTVRLNNISGRRVAP